MSLCNEFPALLWTVDSFDDRCYFYPARDCPGWERGSLCARIQREIPMTEDTGWAQDPAPAAEAAPAGPAEAPVVQEAPPEAEPVSVAPGAPYVPENQPEWLRLLVAGIDERLRALGG